MAEIGDVQVASLRSLDDFLLESARFQVPNFKDLEKWNNRVYQNLLYYQTNYFLTYFAVFLLVGVLHPSKMLCGTLAMGAAGGLFYYLTSNQQPATDFKKNHPLVFMGLMLALTYFLVYLLGSVAVFLLGILLPLIVIFVHASMRLRNLRNKVLNKIEWTGLRRSPMGVLLDGLGWDQEINM